jgi:hypothetical protein
MKLWSRRREYFHLMRVLWREFSELAWRPKAVPDVDVHQSDHSNRPQNSWERRVQFRCFKDSVGVARLGRRFLRLPCTVPTQREGSDTGVDMCVAIPVLLPVGSWPYDFEMIMRGFCQPQFVACAGCRGKESSDR